MQIEIIKKIVKKKTKVNLDDPEVNRKRIRKNVTARKLYFKLCKDFTNLSLDQIGKTIRPSKHHATVLHNTRAAADHIDAEIETRLLYEDMLALIEYIHNKQEEGELDITEAITRLGDCDETVHKLEKINEELRLEIEDLKDKMSRQNRYLKEQGYQVNRIRTNDL